MKNDQVLEPTDEDLASKTLIDVSAFEILVARYDKKILNYISRLLNYSKEDAQDVCQETFLKAYRKMASFKANMKFSSWLYRIAHNETVNFIKKNSKLKTHSLENNEYIKNTLASDEDILKNIIAKQSDESVAQALNSIDMKYREPLLLFYFEQKNYTEIADILKMSTNSVGPTIQRAKGKIKVRLQEMGNEKR